MENKEIARFFKLTARLMELHGDNKFKVGSYANAAFQISKYPEPIVEMDPDYYGTIPGIGKTIIPKLEELLNTGELSYLNEWLTKTPKGVVEMLSIKGIGPSKVRTIWTEMEIESPGELLYACNENRLVDLKGFGDKTQAQVKAAIEFMMEHQNRFLYASVEELIKEIKEWVIKNNPGSRISEIGDAARKSLTLDKLEFLVSNATVFPETSEIKVKVELYSVFDIESFKRSAAEEHLSGLTIASEKTATEVYSANGLSFIPVEMREGRGEFDWAKKHTENELVCDSDLLGCLHNHSNYSDGIHTLEQMASYLKSKGYDYFGISDHSQSAVYAGGLKVEDVFRQRHEIDALNEKMAPFKVLKGIESDILTNGDLDYENEVLESFDFVVASIHSAMKMDEHSATKRLIKAIENPCTKILGHPTGRLLLSRPGYPIDHKRVIDACAANGVSIELNANPMRLDIDWTWIPYCMEKNVMVSINPDAHRMEGIHHMKYGVIAARKGGLLKSSCLNAFSLAELEKHWNL
jgi:DNA polymerase (family X)